MYFGRLKAAIKKYNIQKEDFWNIDKSGFVYSCLGGSIIITRQEYYYIYTKDPRNRENITVIEYVNAIRGKIKPIVIISQDIFREK